MNATGQGRERSMKSKRMRFLVGTGTGIVWMAFTTWIYGWEIQKSIGNSYTLGGSGNWYVNFGPELIIGALQ